MAVALIVSLLFPLLLLGMVLAMELVERPLQEPSIQEQLTMFLESARPEEVEAFISEGFGPALDRYWKRRRLARLVPGLPR